MPRISEFNGILIQMFHREHGPPHFHATSAEDEALIEIDPIRILDGRLPPRARRLVFAWAALHQPGLLDNWRRAMAKKSLQRIDPLD